MKNFLRLISVILIGFFYQVDGQEVVKKDTLNGNILTITMDEKIAESIENMEEKCATKFSNSSSNTTSSNTYTSTPSTVKTTTTKIVIPSRPLTDAEICSRNPRILGFKIQLVVVKSKQEADEVGLYFRRRFPNIKVQQDASLRPNYKVLAGSYKSRESANRDFKMIKSVFKSAIPIQYMVFCAEAK